MTAGRSPQGWIALLGRRDEPTDGVEDECRASSEGFGVVPGNATGCEESDSIG